MNFRARIAQDSILYRDLPHVVGSEVEAWCEIGQRWYHATILDLRGREYFIHYTGWAPSYNLWVQDSHLCHLATHTPGRLSSKGCMGPRPLDVGHRAGEAEGPGGPLPAVLPAGAAPAVGGFAAAVISAIHALAAFP